MVNEGIAPIYRDAYFANDKVRSEVSLKGLLPREKRTIEFDDPRRTVPDTLSIESDFLVPGQSIQFAADL